MLGERRSRTNWGVWAAALAIALAVQVPLFLGFYLQTGTDLLSLFQLERQRPLTVGLVRYTKPEVAVEPDEPAPVDAQIVEVPEMPEPPEPVEVEVERLADKDTRVKKETRSREIQKPTKQKRVGDVDVKEPSEVQSPASKSPDKTVTDAEEKVVELQKSEHELPEADKGVLKRDSVLYEGDKTQLLLPSTTEKAALANLQALSGTFATDDHLPDVEPGQNTLLNANKYKYADFFYRVKDAVRRNWHPNNVYRRRDPTGKVYGVKDRHTILAVTLDDAGRLKRLVTKKNSGLDFMDAEAASAFKRASPFPNPPKGLVDDRGEINFEFGFYFEISSGRAKFRWRRM